MQMTDFCSQHEKFQYKCKECCKQYQRKHYQENKARYKEKHSEWYQNNKDTHNEKQFSRYVKERYDLSVTEYKQLIKEKPNCEICGISFEKTRPNMDHDHFTGKVRGVLCTSCNQALGLFKDHSLYLKLAYQYLEKHELAE